MLVARVLGNPASINEKDLDAKGEEMKAQMQESNTAGAKVVSAAAWLEARKEFLKKEKEFTRLRDELSRQRRELPWEKVEKEYVFEGSHGKATLAELFDGRSQLIVYHFMFGPEWQEGCPGCSFVSDHLGGSIPHLNARDVTLVAISHAPIGQIEEFKKRMGWGFRWLSSNGNDFNRDYHVSFGKEDVANGQVYYNYESRKFPKDEGPGASVFFKDAEENIYHTYSTFGRGLEVLLGTYSLLDMVPKGRDEEALPSPMAWVRHHDRYVDGRAAGSEDVHSPVSASQAAPSATHKCCSGE
ncbi:MAG: DUF899 domain-containing protein [Candidatus Acidiferrum sp.]|jgi:predicted dithiol-disulfide oxidoreductase (DUF899 family)